MIRSKIAKSNIIRKQCIRKYSSVLCRNSRNKLLKTHIYTVHGQRGIGFVFRALRGVLRIRYVILGSAVGGGVQLSKVEIFENFKVKE